MVARRGATGESHGQQVDAGIEARGVGESEVEAVRARVRELEATVAELEDSLAGLLESATMGGRVNSGVEELRAAGERA